MGKTVERENALIIETLKWFADSSNEMLILLDSKGRIKYVNASFEKNLQYDFSELVHMNYLDLIHDDDREKTMEVVKAIQNKNFFSPYTNRYRRKDGTFITLLWCNGKAINDGWVHAVARLSEDTIENFGKDLANYIGANNLFDISEEAADMCDLEGRVIFLNSAFEQMYGWKSAEIMGKTLPVIPEHLQYEFGDIVGEVLVGKKLVHRQTLRMKKDGTIFPVSLIVSPIIDDTGRIIGNVAITKDLTELLETKMLIERQNEVIAEREKLLLEITENISEVICLFDFEQSKFLYISPSYEKLWGFNIEAMYTDPTVMFERFEPEDFERIKRIFSSPCNDPIEIEFKLKDIEGGEERWVRTKVTPMANENGQITRNLSVTQDITEWKKKDQMIKKQDKLGVLGQLAAGIAHEIRNPLTAVKGFSQLIAQESKSTYNHIILTELERIESIVNEFLMLAKPQEEMKFVSSDINVILQEVIFFMNPEALLHKVQINMNFERKLPAISCEPKQIKQVVMNLIKNAIESMPLGGNIHIATTLMPNGYVQIEVKDEGMGIPKEFLNRLGEPFYSNKEKGTGLGLMVSYKIIENHRGTIQFTNNDEKGTTVTIKLPSDSGE
ncbi:PAS domain-containing protein [Lederbergia citrea]|uniref:PAS domain-containing protein n=1 Tax=Lederbergia citrea TaxID=2833581 RepID=UPI001BC93035|nr:PAS domain S-box protein [Lederbergia citrea]MBS4206170.1 PAS domain S-box protein [Lederbergia citrea]